MRSPPSRARSSRETSGSASPKTSASRLRRFQSGSTDVGFLDVDSAVGSTEVDSASAAPAPVGPGACAAASSASPSPAGVRGSFISISLAPGYPVAGNHRQNSQSVSGSADRSSAETVLASHPLGVGGELVLGLGLLGGVARRLALLRAGVRVGARARGLVGLARSGLVARQEGVDAQATAQRLIGADQFPEFLGVLGPDHSVRVRRRSEERR